MEIKFETWKMDKHSFGAKLGDLEKGDVVCVWVDGSMIGCLWQTFLSFSDIIIFFSLILKKLLQADFDAIKNFLFSYKSFFTVMAIEYPKKSDGK